MTEQWAFIAALGFAGLGLGVGLVVGAFVARSLSRYMLSEGFRRKDRGDDD